MEAKILDICNHEWLREGEPDAHIFLSPEQQKRYLTSLKSDAIKCGRRDFSVSLTADLCAGYESVGY